MARHQRIQIAGLIRHVMARGNGRMPIFLDDTDYRWFVHLLGEVVEDLEVECWNYCLMPNHYHATLRPTLPNLSEAVRRLNGTYAQWWNKRHSRVGHVFQGRFKDQIVQREGYLLTLSRYVALNPVRAKLVQDPQDWPWSSYAATVGKGVPPSFLAVDSVLRQFGQVDRRILQSRFADLVQGDPQDESAEDRIRSNERILGDSLFKRSFRDGAESQENIEAALGAAESSTL
jgi:putative transposase